MLKGIMIIIFLPFIILGLFFKGFFKVFLGISGVMMGFGALKAYNRKLDNDLNIQMAELTLDNLRHTSMDQEHDPITQSLPRHLRKRKTHK